METRSKRTSSNTNCPRINYSPCEGGVEGGFSTRWCTGWSAETEKKNQLRFSAKRRERSNFYSVIKTSILQHIFHTQLHPQRPSRCMEKGRRILLDSNISSSRTGCVLFERTTRRYRKTINSNGHNAGYLYVREDGAKRGCCYVFVSELACVCVFFKDDIFHQVWPH